MSGWPGQHTVADKSLPVADADEMTARRECVDRGFDPDMLVFYTGDGSPVTSLWGGSRGRMWYNAGEVMPAWQAVLFDRNADKVERQATEEEKATCK